MMDYEVSKERGGQYYAHPKGHSESPVKGSFGDKKKAIKVAARLCGVTPKEYIAERRKRDENECKPN